MSALPSPAVPEDKIPGRPPETTDDLVWAGDVHPGGAEEAPEPLHPVTPVFVYGALRSGTTVFRLMLDSHPGIANPGEADFLFDHLVPDPVHPSGWRYDLRRLRMDRTFRSYALDLPAGLDGLDLLRAFVAQLAARQARGQVLTLNVHRNIGRLNWIYPEARLVHLLRDPRDVARSSVRMGWAGHLYFGVDHWIATESGWDCVAPWLNPGQSLTLRYEDLVSAPEHELTRVCAFLGADWSADMLRYHETSTYGPPDPALVGQWRRKCDSTDVALLEGKAGALMAARSYPRTGLGRRPILATHLWLWAGHKTRNWRFGIRRHGAAVFLGEKIARWLGLAGLEARLRERMNRVEAAMLK